MTPDEIAALKKSTIQICTKHREENRKKVNYRPCVFVPPRYFVKFGDRKTLRSEVATQRYISEYAKSQRDTPLKPRIANVVHYFEGPWWSYLVMEHITLTTPPPDFIERIAEAVKWLSGVPPPVDHLIGPLGGGRIRHKFFKDWEAPLSFPSVAAVERYMEKGYSLLPAPMQNLRPPVKICGDRLMFAQSDMDLSNFGIDESGKTVIMDFETVGLLPETFVAYTMSPHRALPIATSLGLSYDSIASMSGIAWLLWMSSDPRLGLNEQGYPKTRATKRIGHG